jgi:hypothetical protein
VEQEDVMSKFRFVVASIVVTSALALGSSLNASSIAHTNYMTFSGPFSLPGVSLPAGTYVFETPLAPSSADVVRVTSRDGRHVYLMAFTRTVTRAGRVTSSPQIQFGEVSGGSPAPVKIWYPAGQLIGHEFLY